MPDLVPTMVAHFRKLLLDFEVRCGEAQVSHAGERGRLLEGSLMQSLRSLLPARVGLGTGQIVGAANGEPSRQIDLVLYDALNFPLLLNDPSYQLFMTESVLAAIAVKSTLDKAELEDAAANVSSAKAMRKFPEGKHPATLGAVFAYRTSWKKPQTVIENLYRLAGQTPEIRPDLVCCLNPGFIFAATNSLGPSVASLGTILAGTEKTEPYPQGKFALLQPLDGTQEHILLYFYLILIDHVNTSLGIGVTMSQYIKTNTAWRENIV